MTGALGAVLRRVLTARAVTTCLGVSAITGVPALAATGRAPVPCPPAAAPIWLWCAGQDVDAATLAKLLGDALPAAIAAGLVTVDGAWARATVTLAPIGAGLVVGDRHDADPDDAARVPWPDDSTLHLFHCLPARIGAWLDVGTGAAALPIAAGARAARVRATDVATRSLARARDGLALADRDDVELAQADLLDGAGAGWALVSFNAPIPGERSTGPASGWHRSPIGADVRARFWRAAADVVAPDGEVLVHSAIDDARAALPGGAWTIARYTPAGGPGFAITRWRPRGPDRLDVIEVALAPGRPYVTRADLDAIDPR